MNITRFKVSILSGLGLLILLGLLYINSSVTLATPNPLEVAAVPTSEEVLVPAGQFLMGCSADTVMTMCDGDAKPIHAVYLDAYYIDKTEVTNAQYAACVDAGVCLEPLSDHSGKRNNYYPYYSNYPVLYVDWTRADTYCRWIGKRVPTEAEWEKAARGPDMQLFPWGNEPPNCNLTNFNNCRGDTVPVGSYPDGISPYGALDMIGNAREWVSDLYTKHYYSESPYYNPKGPNFTDKGERLVRGGSWYDNLRVGANTWVRLDEASIYDRDMIGFRCARSAPDIPSTATPTPTRTPTPTPTATPFAAGQIDEEGGAVWMATAHNLALLKVPAGVLGSSMRFTVTHENQPYNQQDLRAVNIFKLEAQALDPQTTNYVAGRFRPAQELFIEFKYNNSVLPQTVTLYRLDDQQRWVTDGITITEKTRHYIVAKVDQPGIYSLLGQTNRLYLPVTVK